MDKREKNQLYKRLFLVEQENRKLKAQVDKLTGAYDTIKEFVEAKVAIVSKDAASVSIKERVRTIIYQNHNRKIQAIKDARREFGLTLLDSKNLIEQYWNEYN